MFVRFGFFYIAIGDWNRWIRSSRILLKEVPKEDNTKNRKETISKKIEIEKFSEFKNDTDPLDPRSMVNLKQER